MPADPNVFSDAELRDLLRDPSVTPESIVEEMLGAGATPLPPDALTAARRVLASLDGPDAAIAATLPERLRTLVVDAAVVAKAASFVGALAASTEKAAVKDAKRAMHLLRTQGVTIDVPRAAPAAPAPAPVAEELPAFMSNADGAGERVVFIPCRVRGGVDVAQVVLSDELGVVSAHLAPLGRKEYRRFIEGLSKSSVLVGEVPRPYARGLIARALDLNARARRAVPQGFNEVSFALGPTCPPQPSPGRSLAVPENAGELVGHSAALLSLGELKGWLPTKDAVVALGKRFDDLAATPFDDDGERAKAQADVTARAAGTYWTADRCALVAERLFDLAWLLAATPRTADAALALATAHALCDEARTPDALPFCGALFDRVARELKTGGTRPAQQRPLF